jgi:hypothetical protein
VILVDRIGVIWALLAAITIAMLYAVSGIPFGDRGVLAVLIVAGVPWILLRAIDFIATGTIRIR